jgi:hypothetical protein
MPGSQNTWHGISDHMLCASVRGNNGNAGKRAWAVLLHCCDDRVPGPIPSGHDCDNCGTSIINFFKMWILSVCAQDKTKPQPWQTTQSWQRPTRHLLPIQHECLNHIVEKKIYYSPDAFGTVNKQQTTNTVSQQNREQLKIPHSRKERGYHQALTIFSLPD